VSRRVVMVGREDPQVRRWAAWGAARAVWFGEPLPRRTSLERDAAEVAVHEYTSLRLSQLRGRYRGHNLGTRRRDG
jgi:hypothetical protein